MYRRGKADSLRPNERGFVVVMAAATLVVALGISALVVDAGMVYSRRIDIAKAVDFAAMAGAQHLPNDRTTASAAATEYLLLNTPGLPDINITFPTANSMQVDARLTVPAAFSKIFGYNTIDVVATAGATNFAADIVLIVDRSGSMCQDSHWLMLNCPIPGPWEPFNTIQNAAKSFVDQLAAADLGGTMSLISYSTTPTIDVLATTNVALMHTAIDNLVPAGYTDIAAPMEEAIDALIAMTGPNPKLIVLLTDGVPNANNGHYVPGDPAPRNQVNRVAKEAKRKGVLIGTISYGNNADGALMAATAEATDGNFYDAPDAAGLAAAYKEIAETSRVRLTYVDDYPKKAPPSSPGGGPPGGGPG